MNHHIKNDLGTGEFEIYDGDDYITLNYNPSADPDLDDVHIIGAVV